jgi:hypothetical protein
MLRSLARKDKGYFSHYAPLCWLNNVECEHLAVLHDIRDSQPSGERTINSEEKYVKCKNRFVYLAEKILEKKGRIGNNAFIIEC